MEDLTGATTLYLFAVASSCAASFCLALGLILMKVANIKVEKDQSSRYYCQAEWLFGLVLLFFNMVLNLSKLIRSIHFAKLIILIFS